MAKAKIVLALLATAQILAETNKDERLIDGIAKLEALEDATHSTTEYKNLKLIVDELENNAGDDKSNNNDEDGEKQNDDLPPKDDGENTGDENNVNGENNAGDDKSNNNDEDGEKQNDDLPPKDDGENTGDENNVNGENNAGDDNFDAIVQEKPKKLNFTGIKMIGNKWYSIKDNYKKSFETAQECAKHFN